MEIKYSLYYLPLVVKYEIAKLDKKNKEIIKKTIFAKLLTNPNLFGKPLRYSLKGYRVLRIGKYRILFKIENDTITISAITRCENANDLFTKHLNQKN